MAKLEYFVPSVRHFAIIDLQHIAWAFIIAGILTFEAPSIAANAIDPFLDNYEKPGKFFLVPIVSTLNQMQTSCNDNEITRWRSSHLPVEKLLVTTSQKCSLLYSKNFDEQKDLEKPLVEIQVPELLQSNYQLLAGFDKKFFSLSDNNSDINSLVSQLEHFSQTSQPPISTMAAARLATYYKSQFEFTKSNQHAQSLINPAVDSDKFKILANTILAENYFSLQDFILAKKHFKNLFEHVEFSRFSPLLQISVLSHLGFCEILIAENTQDNAELTMGKIRLEMALQQTNSIQATQFLGTIYNGLATYHRLIGDLDESAKMLELAIQYLATDKTQNTQEAQSSLTNNLALIYQWTGNLAKSQHYLRRSIYLDKQLKNPVSLAISYANLANSYRLLGDIHKAKRFYQQSLALSSEVGDQLNFGLNKLELGQLEIAIGEYPQAIKNLTDALPIIEQYSAHKRLITQVQLALAYLFNGQRSQASELFELVLTSDYDTMNAIGKTELQLSLLELAIELKDSNNTNILTNEIDATQLQSTSANIHWHKLRFKIALLGAESGEDKTTKFEQGKQLQLIFDQAHSEIKRTARSLDSEEVGLNWMTQASQLFDLYMDFLLNSNDIENQLIAWELSEQTRNLVIQKRRQYYSGRTEQHIEGKDKLNAKIQTATLNTLSADVHTQSKYQYTLDHLREQQLLNKGLEKEKIDESLPLLSLTGTQKLIANDTLLLKYVLVKQQYFVFWLRQNDWGVQKLSLPVFQKLKDYISAQSETNPINSFNFTSESILPKGPTAYTNVKKLIILPDGDLHSFPFVAIRDDKHNHLGEKLQIVRALSASSYFAASINIQFDNTRGIGIFSDPEFNKVSIQSTVSPLDNDWQSQFQRLPWTAEITPYLEKLFQTSKFTSVSGSEATNSALLSDSMRQTKVLHIATHAYYDKSKPDLVGLVTAQQTADPTTGNIGFLSIYDILEKAFYSQLIIISACESQMGRHYGGEGVRGLAYSMLAQGAGSVIGTLWKVPDKPTALFMQNFYQAFKNNGGNSVKALHSARQEFIHSGRYKHPKYWAGFVLTVANKQYETIQLN